MYLRAYWTELWVGVCLGMSSSVDLVNRVISVSDLWWSLWQLWLLQTQFLLVSVHTSQLFFYYDCSYPMMFAYWIGLYAVIFLVLFVDFYVKSYRKPATSSAKSTAEAASLTNGMKKLQWQHTVFAYVDAVMCLLVMTDSGIWCHGQFCVAWKITQTGKSRQFVLLYVARDVIT